MMFLRQIYDDGLAQAAYMIGCQQTGEALMIDPERDIDRYYRMAEANNLKIVAVAETHIHADFVSGAGEFSRDPDVTLYLSALGGEDWSYRWPDDSTRVNYLKDGDQFKIGAVEIQVVYTPGHTPEHVSFVIIDRGGGADQPVAIATGDFLFVGDVGRPDLLENAAGVAGAMEPAARELRGSLVDRIQPLADFVQVLPGHGAGSSCGKDLGAIPTSTIGYERLYNGPLRLAQRNVDDFIREILSGQPEPPLYFKRMKMLNRDGVRVTEGVPQCLHLTPAEAIDATSRDEVSLVDTRADRSAFQNSHAPDAISAPLSGSSLGNSVGSFLTEDDHLVLIVDDEQSVDEVIRQLYRIGMDNCVGWITFDEYIAAGLKEVSMSVIEFTDFNTQTIPSGASILDVRTTSEFDEGHLRHAQHFPHTRLRERLSELPNASTYYVYCDSGRRASLTVSFLKSHGFDAVLLNGSGRAHFQPDAA